ncbi:MAG: molybdate ABC transporter substrate-binding protein [Dehalococcoidia bacterium]|nr:molybdate ABC transporter substrate-binding protein [Dehalococcoidia bacterium]
MTQGHKPSAFSIRMDIILGMNSSAGFNSRFLPRMATQGIWAALAVAACLALFGCGGERELLVFAATSLRDPLTQVSEIYEIESGVNVNLSFGASQSLAQQIASGAPADVFISAGRGPVDFLEEKGLASIPGSHSLRLLSNELVVVTRDISGEIDSLETLASDAIERIALADPALAPAGTYAEEALRSAGVWDGLQGKLLLGKDVRAAMTYVEVGNADAGIVYRTDALSSDSLEVVYSIDPVLHSTIIYPAVSVNGSSSTGDASGYLEFISSEESISVFRRFGFSETMFRRIGF